MEETQTKICSENVSEVYDFVTDGSHIKSGIAYVGISIS